MLTHNKNTTSSSTYGSKIIKVMLTLHDLCIYQIMWVRRGILTYLRIDCFQDVRNHSAILTCITVVGVLPQIGMP